MVGLDVRFMEGDSVVWWGSVGQPDSSVSVYYQEIDEPFPDSLRYRLCEYKRNRNGQPHAVNHAALRACPQPWLDSARTAPP
jgi:hypothetical protein